MSPTPRRIAVLRALHLGDLLCAVPALRALRAAFPAADITLIGLPWARSFAARFHHLINGYLELPGYPGLPEHAVDVRRLPAALAAAQASEFDLAIQLHGSGLITNPLLALLGARSHAGFAEPDHYCPDPARFIPFPRQGHEIHRLLALTTALGMPARGDHLEFPLTEGDEREAHALQARFGLAPGSYVCVHPGARLRSRRWPPERFAAVAESLARRGLRVVLTGAADEAPLTAALSAAAATPVVDLAGRTSLGAVGALVRDARLLVSNDTGLSHVAAALGTHSVVVASGSDVNRWAPLDRSRHRVLWAAAPCRPCAFDDCPVGHPCALAVTVAAAVTAADDLLSTTGVSAPSVAPRDAACPPPVYPARLASSAPPAPILTAGDA